jgi:hypothetical protein
MIWWNELSEKISSFGLYFCEDLKIDFCLVMKSQMFWKNIQH